MYVNEYEVEQGIQQKIRGKVGAEEGPLRHQQSERPYLEIC
jgi:hypothetical protein